MLVVYLTALASGGSLLLMSILATGDGGDADLDGDVDADGGDGMDWGGLDAWLPFGSLRFWTFFAAFFGLVGTGTLLASDLPKYLTLVPSIAVGYICGISAVRILRNLTGDSVGKVVGGSDLVGMTGTLSLPASTDAPGKIRLSIGGRSIDHFAHVDDEAIKAGEAVIVLSPHKEGGVLVARAPQLTE